MSPARFEVFSVSGLLELGVITDRRIVNTLSLAGVRISFSHPNNGVYLNIITSQGVIPVLPGNIVLFDIDAIKGNTKHYRLTVTHEPETPIHLK